MNFCNIFGVILVFSILNLCRSEEMCLNVDEDGTCLEHCSEGMFVYQSSCENETMSQQTCREPVARSLGFICDYTRCECNDSKLWDEAVKKCVMVEECSDQSNVIEEEEKTKKENSNNSAINFETEFIE